MAQHGAADVSRAQRLAKTARTAVLDDEVVRWQQRRRSRRRTPRAAATTPFVGIEQPVRPVDGGTQGLMPFRLLRLIIFRPVGYAMVSAAEPDRSRAPRPARRLLRTPPLRLVERGSQRSELSNASLSARCTQRPVSRSICGAAARHSSWEFRGALRRRGVSRRSPARQNRELRRATEPNSVAGTANTVAAIQSPSAIANAVPLKAIATPPKGPSTGQRSGHAAGPSKDWSFRATRSLCTFALNRD